MKRREYFMQGMSLLAALVGFSGMKKAIGSPNATESEANHAALKMTESNASKKPVVLSTWDYGLRTNAEAWKILHAKGSALDAVIAGAEFSEMDPE